MNNSPTDPDNPPTNPAEATQLAGEDTFREKEIVEPAPGITRTNLGGPAGPKSEPGVPADLARHPRYDVLECLGSGGMGTVYKARHRLMDRLVALKVIHSNLVGRPDAVSYFRQEIRAAARLTHPNIVHAYDADQAGTTHFFVMEYVEGTNLARLAEQVGRLPLAQACEYVRQAALGLQHAHECGMVHGDVKPHNLMLTPSGVVKILDFGLARFAGEGALPAADPEPVEDLPAQPPGDADDDSWGTAPTRLAARERTAEGPGLSWAAVGTPDYVAPEIADGLAPPNVRADVYALGCTLYRLLSGQVPFPGGSPEMKFRAHREREPRPLAELRPEVPAALARVVGRMLAKDPERRYQTPGEVARDLAPFTAPAARHVLVVDDNVAIREVMAAALGSKGYQVSGAANGQEALEVLRREALPDLILLDLMMPVMDGWQFLHARRQDARLAAVPVLIVSALDTSQAEAVALDVAGHLQKPVEPEALWSAVSDHTQRA